MFIPEIKKLGHGPQARLVLAYAHFTNGNHSQTIAECETALILNPRFAEAHILLAKTYKDLGRYAEAIASCRSALAANSKLPQAYLILGYIYQEQGQ